MRGMGDFQRAQMKHRDARVSAMAPHLRAAVDLWEGIQLYPFKKRRRPNAATATATAAPARHDFVIRNACVRPQRGSDCSWSRQNDDLARDQRWEVVGSEGR